MYLLNRWKFIAFFFFLIWKCTVNMDIAYIYINLCLWLFFSVPMYACMYDGYECMCHAYKMLDLIQCCAVDKINDFYLKYLIFASFSCSCSFSLIEFSFFISIFATQFNYKSKPYKSNVKNKTVHFHKNLNKILSTLYGKQCVYRFIMYTLCYS